MKNLCKIAVLSVCILLIPFSASYSQDDEPFVPIFTPLDGYVYYLYVKGPARIWTPTLEFEAGNNLIVIGASHEYGRLDGVWQEAPLGLFSFFWAQVESDEPANTTTTIPDDPSDLLPQSIQPQQTEKTKFLINLWGLSFPSIPFFASTRVLIGSGDYLGATGVVYTGFSATTETPQCKSIDPTSGKQKETDIQVDLVGQNTKFVKGSTQVTFSGTGINVSGITVENNTKLSFNISIDEEAAVGERDVIVTYPGNSVVCTKAFTVDPL